MTQEEFHKRYQYNPNTDCLGEGGFGKVYKAYDTHRDRYVAIKMAEVKPHLEEVRLKKEVEIISKLPSHPNIAYYEECYTFSTFAGEYDFGVLQYYDEGNLQQLFTDKKLSYEQKDSILRQILEGIAFLHSQGIIHRDLKPQNILISNRNGKYIPKITDFGISKKLDVDKSSIFTNSLAGAGTLSFASPEQLMGNTIRKNTDLWSFGVIAIWLFTSKLPFTAGTPEVTSEAGRIELFKQITSGDILSIIQLLPSSWKNLISQCIKVDINSRISSASKSLEMLDGKVEEIIEEPLSENTTINETIISNQTNFSTREIVSDNSNSSELGICYQTKDTVAPNGIEQKIEASKRKLKEPSPKPMREPKKSKTGIFSLIVIMLALIAILFFIVSPKGTSKEGLLERAKQDSIARADNLTISKSEKVVQAENNDMVFVKGGTFYMGNNSGFADEKPLHKVILSDFLIDKYEVTTKDFAQFIESTGYITDAEKSGFGYILNKNYYFVKKSNINWRHDEYGNQRDASNSLYPVMRISWNDAFNYAKWIGKRLPTEAEWEYAASGGVNSKGYIYSGGNDLNKVANYGSGQIKVVGTLEPNELGIYDMTGNVYEWCQDFYDGIYYKNSPESDPKGPEVGVLDVWRNNEHIGLVSGITSKFHVYRGGSCMYYEEDLRIKNRGRTYYNDAAMATLSGFRCAKN